MSIANKVMIAQEKVEEIFQLLENYEIQVSAEKNLVNLKEDLRDYLESGGIKQKYTIIDYVYADGHQYIDTGIKMKNNIAIELKFKFEDWNDGESLGGFHFNDIDFNILKNYNGEDFKSSIGLEDTYIINSVDDRIHVLDYNTYGNRIVYDDTQKTFVRNIEREDIDENLLIFANSNNGIKPTGRIYSCKIYDNVGGAILRYFIPVIDDNDTACLFDMVTQEFYYSAGDEDFY